MGVVLGIGGTAALPGPEEQAALAERVRLGDREAEHRIVVLFHERVRVVAAVRTRNPEDAKDIAQDVLTAVIAGIRRGQLREGERLGAFVYGTARNAINNYFRASERRPDARPIDEGDAVVDPAEAIEDRDRAAIVREALRSTAPDDRRILLLTLVDGLKPGEIASRLGLTAEVVRARKSRALKKVVDRVRELSRT